ncbi:MAG TPA: HNH endonuclease signature motif containing protein, partial [Acidimicrobiales bacterium]|nr:HNH endonuclease signature motif containing protein [Acidimicrobiales bacterium]
ARAFRSWVDELGLVRVRGALLPEHGMELRNRVEDEAKRRWRAARAAGGEMEPFEAHAHDAFIDLLSGAMGGNAPGGRAGDGGSPEDDGGSGSGGGGLAVRPRARRAEVVFVCDLNAARRGHPLPGEPCHVVGGGRVPVQTILDAVDDAFVKLVTHDGVRIDSVLNLGRYRRAELQSALDLGAPPGFAGAVCVEAGCTRRYGLEWDHINPVTNAGPTSFDNLAPRCWPHHQAKTKREREAGMYDTSRIRRVNDDPSRGGPFDDATDDGDDDERGPPC